MTLGTSQTTTKWEASAYRPVVITAKDDNTVGDPISGSSGNPLGYYANPALSCYFNTPNISSFRIAYAQLAIYAAGTTNSFKNGQIVDCQNGIDALVVTTLNLENILFDSVQTDLYNLIEDNNIYVQNSTFNLSTNLTSTTGSYQTVIPCFTNCVFVNIGQLTNSSGGSSLIYGVSGTYNGFYNSPAFGSPALQYYSTSYPFQAVGAGSFYLATNSSFHNVGTTNIDPTLLASLKQKTTHPPILYSNGTNVANLTLSPQAARETNAAPDLGYHYDPIDFITDLLYVTNSALTLVDGVVVAHCNEDGILLQDGSSINCMGSPLYPNVLTSYQTVQEEPIIFGVNTNPPYGALSVMAYPQVLPPSAVYDFTKFTCLAGGGYLLYHNNAVDSYSALLVENCEFWGGEVMCSGYNGRTAVFNNNLFARSFVDALVDSTGTDCFTNNLFWGSTNLIIRAAGGGSICAFNNDFDSCVVHAYSPNCTNGYNAYLNCSGQLNPTNATDIFSTNGLNYQTSFLGTFYQPTNSALINMGSTNANLLGLFYYTVTTNEMIEATNRVSLGYHYVATDGLDNPLDTYTNDIPDYLEDANGSLGVWELHYFGNIGEDLNSDYDGDGNSLLYDYTNGIDPNIISFSFSFANQYVSTNIVNGIITILGGVPSSIAVLVDSTNFTTATWTAYSSSNLIINLGSTQGAHDVWVGLRGLPSDAHQTWEDSTLVLDSVPPAISITNPADGASFNSTRADVGGNFTAGSLQQITVNGVPAFVNGTNFEALNVPLNPGSNTVTAVVEDFTGATNPASIIVIGLTNTDGSMNDPVDIQATPIAGFAPMQVTFQITSNRVQGTIEDVSYDFTGDGNPDFVTNNLSPITYTYATNGEYFPVVTIQTTAGSYSSSGGWNSSDPNRLEINVQGQIAQLAVINITDPVDIKWMSPSNLYVLSGSTATITELSTNGSTIRSLSGIGDSPSGLDVDGNGNVYVAITGDNQVWKFIPTNGSFTADTNFGNGGYLGMFDGDAGTNLYQFNAPFDVAVSPDGGTISISDSGNDQIQQYTTAKGTFIGAFGSEGNEIGQFNTPKGLTYDSGGTLYIVDSGNNRVVVAGGSAVAGASGVSGTAQGQFSDPVGISVDQRGIYVADAGNNRVQTFNSIIPLAPPTPFILCSVLSTNFNQPGAVAAVDDPMAEQLYVADTGNNRVLLFGYAPDNPTPVWNSATNHLAAGDISDALSSFSSLSVATYQHDFLAIGTNNVSSIFGQIGTLTTDYVSGDKAEGYFTKMFDGQTITFLVEFIKENGVWKIMEF